MRRALRMLWLAVLPLAYAPAAAAQTIYDGLGGRPGLTCIVGHTIDLALADPRIRDKFDDINIDRLKGRIVDHVCTLSGGPCHFKGVSMHGAHVQLQLHEYHFNAMVEDMRLAMDRCGIGFRAQGRLLAVLAPLERDVVSR